MGGKQKKGNKTTDGNTRELKSNVGKQRQNMKQLKGLDYAKHKRNAD